jgi:hypothetical protein
MVDDRDFDAIKNCIGERCVERCVGRWATWCVDLEAIATAKSLAREILVPFAVLARATMKVAPTKNWVL